MMTVVAHSFSGQTARYTQEEFSANVARVLLQLGADPEKITPTADFCDDLGLSVSDKNILLLSLEYRFKVIIAEEEESTLTNINRVVQYLVAASQ